MGLRRPDEAGTTESLARTGRAWPVSPRPIASLTPRDRAALAHVKQGSAPDALRASLGAGGFAGSGRTTLAPCRLDCRDYGLGVSRGERVGSVPGG